MSKGSRRDPGKERYWRRMVARQARSGVSVRAWCGRHGQREPAFHWWRRELRRRDAELPGGSARVSGPRRAEFVPVHLRTEASPRTDGRIEIVLGGDLRVRVRGPIDRQALAEVLAVLDERSPPPGAASAISPGGRGRWAAGAGPEPERAAC